MQSSVSERAILHLLGGTPGGSLWQTARNVVTTGHALLLWQDAVSAALANGVFGDCMAEFERGVELYVYAPDLEMRGLAGYPLRSSIKKTDAAGLVELACRFPLSHTWF